MRHSTRGSSGRGAATSVLGEKRRAEGEGGGFGRGAWEKEVGVGERRREAR